MKLSQEAIHHLSPEERIIPFDKTPDLIRKLGDAGLHVLIVQGVFDIVHAGHTGLLQATRQIDPRNSVIMIGLENDQTVQKNKGEKRPINPLADRLKVVGEFRSVAFTFGYEDTPDYRNPEDYVDRWRRLRPATVVAASWDPHRDLKERQAQEAGTRLELVDYQHENSTTRMLRSVGYEE